MPPPAPRTPADARPRRRSVLAGAFGAVGTTGCRVGAASLVPLGLLTGCTDGGGVRAERERADLTARLRRTAVRQSEDLLERYTGTARAHASLASGLTPFRETVRRHLTALGGPEEEREEQGSGRSASPTPSRAERAPAPNVPLDPADALKALAEAERRTAREREAALREAPPETARLLASLAAAGSVSAYLLSTEGAEPLRTGADAGLAA